MLILIEILFDEEKRKISRTMIFNNMSKYLNLLAKSVPAAAVIQMEEHYKY